VNTSQKILVIENSGYIGSHYVRRIYKAVYRTFISGNFVFGHKESISDDAGVFEGDLGEVVC